VADVRIHGPRTKRYGGRLTKTTGENEVIEITFAGDDAGELKTAIGHAVAAVEDRMARHNAKILKMGDEVAKRLDAIKAQVRAEIEADVRAEIAARDPGTSSEGDHADAATG
jgi:hypothetical protein